MTRDDDDMTALDALLAQARAEAPTPGAGLMARIAADAAAVAAARAAPPPAPRRGLWPTLSEALGGWPAIGGLLAATLAGVWIGFAPPAGLAALGGDTSTDTGAISLFWDDSDLEIEG